jgi:transcriptional regulator of acetoin/glycerol metabolism
VNCRTRQFQVVTTADQCQPASFIIENASGTVQVFANIDHHGPVSLQLTDVTGRLVYRNADYQNELSTSTLSSGLYWYSLQIAGDCPVSLGGVLLVQR